MWQPSPTTVERIERIGTGLCFILFPIAWIFAFWAHSNLLEPQVRGLETEEMIRREHHSTLLRWGHLLVGLNTTLMIPIALHYMYLLGQTANSFLGFFGAAFAIFGAVMMAANKGALCLIMSATDGLQEDEFEQIMPWLLLIFSFEGYMFLTWGMILCALGVLVQITGMMRENTLPHWQLRLLFVGILFIGYPDGAEIINLVAACLMAIAMIPYGIKLIRNGSMHSYNDKTD